ncbi:hypothetical protein L1987_37022 [Smallanthus sonchifolius]|uniref:Uncharacterized protein n=1 Tax=Smallanthus sonchifolius TaxID=185202 RepID=A0ACB9HFV8_9ASTR|nr:hypothetical protein L1987_37022 [Smallanthus sonchifolius]
MIALETLILVQPLSYVLQLAIAYQLNLWRSNLSFWQNNGKEPQMVATSSCLWSAPTENMDFVRVCDIGDEEMRAIEGILCDYGGRAS